MYHSRFPLAAGCAVVSFLVLGMVGAYAQQAQTSSTDNIVVVAPALPAASDASPVCRQMAPATGSRLGGRKICHTQAEWEYIDMKEKQATQSMNEKMQRITTGASGK